jgi:spore maturation protein CgeB
MGEWTEGVGKAAEALGHHTALFYYYDGGTSNRLKDMATRSLHPLLQKPLRILANRLKSTQDALQRIKINRRLIEAVDRFQPDLVLILKGESLFRETLMTLRSRKIHLVSWWVDDPFNYPTYLPHFGLFDTVYLFDKESITKLKALGIPDVDYLPCACDPTTFHPQTLNPEDYPHLNCTIGFVATYYPGRGELLRQMKGLDIGLWGGSWWEVADKLKDLPDGYWRGHRITPADAAKVYNLAKICPNVHHPQTRFGGLNTRTFEIPAAGGFELVDDVPGLAEHFEIGLEMAVYSSPVHFRELTEYYLSHPLERIEFIERGRVRVMRDHTYRQRLETILGKFAARRGDASAESAPPAS